MSVQNVILGLGNPGPEFEHTRHNAGFDVLRTLGGNIDSRHYADQKADVALINNGERLAALARPTTGMNSSGEAAKALLEHFRLPSPALLVVYDDVSLPMGRLRFQHNGGAGGHHGVESTIEQLGGSKEFDRLKIGVGPDPGGASRYQFVLTAMSEAEQELFMKVREAAAEAIKLWLSNGVDAGMRAVNGRPVF